MCRGETATPLWKISTRKYYQTACNKPFSKNLIFLPLTKLFSKGQAQPRLVNVNIAGHQNLVYPAITIY